MLHILWAIIKFILILAGVLIGLALAVILLILFCPVRYRMWGSKDRGGWEHARCTARVSWLLGLVSFRICYQNGKEKHSLKLAGISLFGKKKKRRKKKPETDQAQSVTVPKQPASKQADEKPVMPTQADEKPAMPMQADEKLAVSMQTDSEQTDTASDNRKVKESSVPKPEKSQSSQREGFFRRIRAKLKTVLQRIRAFFKKLKNIRQTFAHIMKKAKWWMGFLRSEEMKEAFGLIKEQCTGLLKHIFPTRISGNAAFGCEDPAVTGMILAVLGMSIPLHKNCIQISPAFENEESFLEGEVNMKGRIYGIVLLRTGIRIYFNKNIKHIINQWKHKEDLNYGK